MGAFRRLNVKRLPRVMVHTLALDPRDQQVLLEELEELARTAQPRTAWADELRELFDNANAGVPNVDEPNLLAILFAAVLEQPLVERIDFADRFDRLLDAQGDLFGTEGQCDPRGDHRDEG